MAEVNVESTGGGDGDKLSFHVTLKDEKTTEHDVTVSQSDFERLRKGDEQPEQFIERCIRYLREREPQDIILKSFDVTEINKYFPEFEQEISG